MTLFIFKLSCHEDDREMTHDCLLELMNCCPCLVALIDEQLIN